MKTLYLAVAITALSVGQPAGGPIGGSWTAKFEGRTSSDSTSRQSTARLPVASAWGTSRSIREARSGARTPLRCISGISSVRRGKGQP